MTKRIALFALTVSLAAISLAGVAQAAPAKPKTIVQIAAGDHRFDTLVSLVKSAGLAPTLSGTTKYTVLAPTDAAFAKVPKATLQKLGKDKALLKKVLLYHVVKGAVPAAKVVKAKTIKTVEGQSVKVTLKGKKVYVNQARVVQTNIKASNGIIHVINRVLSPPAAPAKPKTIVQIAAGDPRFDTLVSLVKSAGLAPTLSGTTKYTVLAPTDAAFAKVPKATLQKLGKDKALLKKVLLYHVVKGAVPAAKVVKAKTIKTVEGQSVKVTLKGKKVYVNQARVVQTNIKASNGIIHVINRVLSPPTPSASFAG